MSVTFEDRMTRRNVHGLSLAVVSQGRLVRSEGYGVLEGGSNHRTAAHHPFHTCSISKTVTAMTALSLVQAGIIDLDTDVNRYISAWQFPTQGVTLRHLLSHQAGIADPDESFDALRPGEAHPELLQILRGETRFHPGPLQTPFAPGERFAYSDAGYCVVEHLLTEVTGQPFARLVQQHVLEPLGMGHSTYTTEIPTERDGDFACGHDRHGQVIPGRRPVYPFQGAAGLWSSAADLAQVALEVMAALQGRGRVLNREMAEAMTTPQWNPYIGLGLFLDAPVTRQPWYYHYGWGQGFQGALSLSPDLQAGIVILMNAEPGVPQWRSLVGELAGVIAEEMGWPRTPTPALD